MKRKGTGWGGQVDQYEGSDLYSYNTKICQSCGVEFRVNQYQGMAKYCIDCKPGGKGLKGDAASV